MKPTADPGRTLMPAYFSSEREDWRTPRALVAELAREFGREGRFQLDPCCTPESAVVTRSAAGEREQTWYYTLEDDGLARPWIRHPGDGWLSFPSVFMNPPYGRVIGKWMAKAALESAKGARVVALVHARTDTRWWHEWVEPHAALVRFLRGRVRFELPDGTTGTAPFPSVVVVYDREPFAPAPAPFHRGWFRTGRAWVESKVAAGPSRAEVPESKGAHGDPIAGGRP